MLTTGSQLVETLPLRSKPLNERYRLFATVTCVDTSRSLQRALKSERRANGHLVWQIHLGRTLGDLVTLKVALIDVKVVNGKSCRRVVGELPSANILDRI